MNEKIIELAKEVDANEFYTENGNDHTKIIHTFEFSVDELEVFYNLAIADHEANKLKPHYFFRCNESTGSVLHNEASKVDTTSFDEWIAGEIDRGLSRLEIDQMRAAWVASKPAAKQEDVEAVFNDLVDKIISDGTKRHINQMIYGTTHPEAYLPAIPEGWQLVPKILEYAELRDALISIAVRIEAGKCMLYTDM